MTDDIESIHALKARYFRFVDTKQWDAFRELFTDDVAVDIGDAGRFDNADAFVSFVSQALDGVTTVHHGHMPEIERTGADEATGVWAMADIVLRPGVSRVMGYGHYHETYRRVAGEWRIASLRLTRLLVEVE